MPSLAVTHAEIPTLLGAPAPAGDTPNVNQVTVVDAPGAGVFTADPAGGTYVREVWGGGAGGAGGGTAAGQPGAGGGGGGYARDVWVAGASETFAYVVGAGGTGGAAGGAMGSVGTDGGNTTVDTTVLVAAGGDVGVDAISDAIGGQAVDCTGSNVESGGDSPASAGSIGSGGGGAGGSTIKGGDGADGTGGGTGGTGYGGGGNGGAGGSGAAGAGAAGVGPGGGGGGGARDAGAPGAGGAGAPGRLRVTKVS